MNARFDQWDPRSLESLQGLCSAFAVLRTLQPRPCQDSELLRSLNLIVYVTVTYLELIRFP